MTMLFLLVNNDRIRRKRLWPEPYAGNGDKPNQRLNLRISTSCVCCIVPTVGGNCSSYQKLEIHCGLLTII